MGMSKWGFNSDTDNEIAVVKLLLSYCYLWGGLNYVPMFTYSWWFLCSFDAYYETFDWYLFCEYC